MGPITFLEDCSHWNGDFFSVLGKKSEMIFQLHAGIKNKWPELETPSRYGLWKMVDKLHTLKGLQDRWPIAIEIMKSV